jgi:hypothetical protein
MVRSIPTRLLCGAFLCCSAMLVGCGSEEKNTPKVKGDSPGLKERPAPGTPGGEPLPKGAKGTGAPGAQTGVQ